MLFDIIQILDHAHVVFGPVAFVDVLYPFAGIPGALEAVFSLPLVTVRHMALSHPVVLTGITPPAARAWFISQKIPRAYAAVHAAWGDEMAFYGGF